jgi:hypothetical protein
MKKALLALLVSAAGFAQAGAPAKAPVQVAPVDDTLGFSATIGYDSKYIFRGVDYGDSLITASLSIPVKLTDNLTFTFAPWYGSAAGGGRFSEDYDELDLFAGLAYDAGFATIGAGYTWYYFPFTGEDTSEPSITISKSFGNVNVFAGAYLDLEADAGSEGFYYEAGLNTSIAITDKLSLVPEAKVSYGTDYYGVDGFNNIALKLGLPYALTKTATLTPYVAGSLAIDSLDDAGEDSYLFGGVSLTVTF